MNEMVKIVYNACYGGFGISDAATMRLAELKGIRIYPEKTKYGLMHYWRIPPDELAKLSERERNNRWDEISFTTRDICRHDPDLVKVVEELGESANGLCAKLETEEVPKGTPYRISEYDGYESIETMDNVEWTIARMSWFWIMVIIMVVLAIGERWGVRT